MIQNKQKINNEVTQAIINGLHYLQNYQNVFNAKSAEQLQVLVDGGVHRYQNDALFHAQVEMMRSRVMHVIWENLDDT